MSQPENKYNLLLKISLVMLAISVVLLFVSGYNLYFKKEKEVVPASVAVSVRSERDSLQDLYKATLKKMDENFSASWNRADTLSTDLDVKIEAFNKLRSEIAGLLKSRDPSSSDLSQAREKITELQLRVNSLRTRNSDVEAENKRLLALLQQLREQNNNTSTASISIPASTVQPASVRTVAKQTGAARSEAPLLTRALQLYAVAADKKTNASAQAEKFVGSFVLRNTADKKNTELMVIVLQPDGKVVRNSVWESGTFESDEGRKAYSKRLVFDPSEEEKQVTFSLNPERFFKGEYTMEIWYNGNLIAMMKKALS